MPSITDIFFECTTRISIYLNGADLEERAADSVVRQVGVRRALLLIHELLVPDLPRSASLDPLPRCFSVVWPFQLVSSISLERNLFSGSNLQHYCLENSVRINY